MARKKKVEPTQEELIQSTLNRELDDLMKKLALIPVPTSTFKIGEKVSVGAYDETTIEDVIEDGKIYLISYTHSRIKHGEKVTHNSKRYVKWLDARPVNENEISLIKNKDMRLSYSQTHLTNLFSKAYYFGVDFEPDYQRDYVWELEDKVSLIDSIFNNVDIGKFAFINLSDEKWEATGYKYSYEVLDGKQRIRALLDYYEDRFEYQGFTFSQLSNRDQNHIENYSVNIAEVRDVEREQVLQYFLQLNTTGKVMDKSHLDKVRGMLESK